MGELDIGRAGVSLGNISQPTPVQNFSRERQFAGLDAFGRGVQNLGEGAYRLADKMKDEKDAADISRLRGIYDQRTAQALTTGYKDAGGNQVTGYLVRHGESARTVVPDYQKFDDALRKELLSEKGLSPAVQEAFSYYADKSRTSTYERLSGHAAAEADALQGQYLKQNEASALELYQAKHTPDAKRNLYDMAYASAARTMDDAHAATYARSVLTKALAQDVDDRISTATLPSDLNRIEDGLDASRGSDGMRAAFDEKYGAAVVQKPTLAPEGRPAWQHPDGQGYGTIASISGQDENGYEVLIPTIYEDKPGAGATSHTDKEAWAHYRETVKAGHPEHFGVYKSVAAADAAAQMMHVRGAMDHGDDVSLLDADDRKLGVTSLGQSTEDLLRYKLGLKRESLAAAAERAKASALKDQEDALDGGFYNLLSNPAGVDDLLADIRSRKAAGLIDARTATERIDRAQRFRAAWMKEQAAAVGDPTLWPRTSDVDAWLDVSRKANDPTYPKDRLFTELNALRGDPARGVPALLSKSDFRSLMDGWNKQADEQTRRATAQAIGTFAGLRGADLVTFSNAFTEPVQTDAVVKQQQKAVKGLSVSIPSAGWGRTTSHDFTVSDVVRLRDAILDWRKQNPSKSSPADIERYVLQPLTSRVLWKRNVQAVKDRMSSQAGVDEFGAELGIFEGTLDRQRSGGTDWADQFDISGGSVEPATGPVPSEPAAAEPVPSSSSGSSLRTL